MADGKAPFGVDLDVLEPVDAGTSAQIDSPTPGPIGLDAKNGAAKPEGATLAQQIVNYARNRSGTRVGDGQCFALADRALRAANAKSAADYGWVTPDADYQWGTAVALSELQPGDVVQFRDYSYEREVITEDDNGTTTQQHAEDRSHHTAIVQSVGANGAVTVLEQNSPEGSSVRRTQLFFTSGTTKSGNTTTTIRVTGSFWFYRPQAR